MTNLDLTYRSQGGGKEAEELEGQVMKTSKRVLSDEQDPQPENLAGDNDLGPTISLGPMESNPNPKQPSPSGTPIEQPHTYQEPQLDSSQVPRLLISNDVDLAHLYPNPTLMPATYKKEGPGWVVVYNPRVPRALDVDLVHTLEHDSAVWSVGFSADGRYIATGGSHSAQIFEVESGIKIQHLAMEKELIGAVDFRSVCFSPDGVYLVTGGDKLLALKPRALCPCKMFETN